MPAEAASRKQVALLPCSRTMSTLRASKGLRPFLRLRSGQDWTNFFEHSLPLMMCGLFEDFIGYSRELFNRPFLGKLFGQVKKAGIEILLDLGIAFWGTHIRPIASQQIAGDHGPTFQP